LKGNRETKNSCHVAKSSQIGAYMPLLHDREGSPATKEDYQVHAKRDHNVPSEVSQTVTLRPHRSQSTGPDLITALDNNKECESAQAAVAFRAVCHTLARLGTAQQRHEEASQIATLLTARHRKSNKQRKYDSKEENPSTLLHCLSSHDQSCGPCQPCSGILEIGAGTANVQRAALPWKNDNPLKPSACNSDD
jgi:hypothetical protein